MTQQYSAGQKVNVCRAPAGNRELNPLQDLVNTLASTTADFGTDALGLGKKGTVPTQGDDSVNLGSEVAM